MNTMEHISAVKIQRYYYGFTLGIMYGKVLD